MTAGTLQLAVFTLLLIGVARPLGAYMAKVYQGTPSLADRLLGPLERFVYRVARIDSGHEMTWRAYATAVLALGLSGVALVYAVLRLQSFLPLNPNGLPNLAPDLAFNTAVSFVTNTNWQAYSGETTASHFSQTVALTTQNFVSAATGMAICAAFIRGLSRKSCATLGNFWVDLVRSVVYVLLPLSIILAFALVSQGVVQTLVGGVSVQWLDPAPGTRGLRHLVALGPVASQVAIKQLGTNGGGYFNANSAHPFENPTPLSNLLECLSILLIPAALCFTFGKMVGDSRQGRTLLATMGILFVMMLVPCWVFEQRGNPTFEAVGIDQSIRVDQSGGNMEGKEVRFGIAGSALWTVATSAASNGSVNAMHDSLTPLGGLVPMLLIQLGEVVFGGVGSGLYGMVVFAIIAVFIAGLMVGRTPEYLGKKIEAFEMKMASLVVLVPSATVLVFTAVAVATQEGRAGIGNPGAHGFSEILYAFSSAANNNGSAFGGLSANTPFYNITLGVAMFIGRYWLAIPVLALAGSLASKRKVPESAGTLPTHTPLFVMLLSGVVLLVGALTFVPALALGPVVEQLLLSNLGVMP